MITLMMHLLPQDTVSLETILLNHNIPKQDGEASAEYSKNPKPYHDLAELQEHFHQLQECLIRLGPTTNPPMHAKELAQLSKKYSNLL